MALDLYPMQALGNLRSGGAIRPAPLAGAIAGSDGGGWGFDEKDVLSVRPAGA